MKKRLLLIVLVFVLFCGCNAKTKTVTIDQFSSALDELFDTNAMVSVDDSIVTRNLKVDSDLLQSYHVMVPTGTNQDEYGVFIAAPGKAADVENQLKAYIKRRQEAWMDEYLPDERPKIFEAEINRHGDYVIYVMAFSETRDAAESAFNKLVK